MACFRDFIFKQLTPQIAFYIFYHLTGTRILIEGIKEMWFVGEMNSNEAEKVLSGHLNGTFMVRLNNERKYVLSVINKVISFD